MTTGTDFSARVLSLVLTTTPDVAIEAGQLPPVLWEDVSASRRAETVSTAQQLLTELEEFDTSDDLLASARYHIRSIQTLVAEHSLETLNHMTGPASRLVWAATSWPLAKDPGAAVYIERLAAFPSYCAQLLSSAPTTKLSRPVLDAFIAQVEHLMSEHRRGNGLLLLPIERAKQDQKVNVPGGLLEGVLEALETLRSTARAMLPSAVPASSLLANGSGARRYGDAIYRGTSMAVSPDDLESLGRGILQRTESRFRQLRAQLGDRLGRSLDPAAAMARFEAVLADLESALPAICRKRPAMPCEVRPMPQGTAVVGPAAFYGPSSKSAGRNGTLFVNSTRPNTIMEWEVLPLTMHEGVPGHHLQCALLDENESLPDLIRLLPVNAFTEGWAVYSERLADTMVALTPLDEFGLLSHQRWRAARLLVDVGLHARGWSVLNATDFMVEATNQQRGAIRSEVVRYLAWPGQALGYAFGAEAIAGWVAQQVADGNQMPDVHSLLLDRGSIPMSCIMPPL